MLLQCACGLRAQANACAMLGELSPNIGLLKNLRKIDLSFNDFITLPPEFYSLQNIEEINLNFNERFNIYTESLGISKLKNLKRLFMIGVKLNSFPEKILILDLEELAVGNSNLV